MIFGATPFASCTSKELPQILNFSEILPYRLTLVE